MRIPLTPHQAMTAPDTSLAHYAVVDARPDPRTAAQREAMNEALAVFAAHGRADRLACEATADWFDPPKSNLLRILFLYAWATRSHSADLPLYRARALSALRAYRRLRQEGRT